MREKLIQAALITFLLHLITVLNGTNQITRKTISPISEMPVHILGSTIRLFK